jgi:hypothetical protein
MNRGVVTLEELECPFRLNISRNLFDRFDVTLFMGRVAMVYTIINGVVTAYFG